jgi:hypothetical protein
LLGEIQGTPTLRLYKPKKKQRKRNSHAEKVVIDYRHGERTVKDMKLFLENEMPNYSERITFGQKDMDKVIEKANKYGLPMALFFTTKPKTSPLIKFLSTEFRRRLLLVEIPPTTNNQSLLKQYYGIDNNNNNKNDKDKLQPVLLIIPPSHTQNTTTTINQAFTKYHKFDGDKFSRRKLQDFLSQYALEEPVYEPKQQQQQVVTEETEGETVQDPSKTEF